MDKVATRDQETSANEVIHRPPVAHACQVINVTPLNGSTYEIELESLGGAALNYRAGQYLELKLDLNWSGQPHSVFYTIANGYDPERPYRLQLFIQNGSNFANSIINHLSQLRYTGQEIQATLAMGRAYLQTDLQLPHLLIASGSGISKIKCITEEILRQNPNAEVNIYWSNKDIDDFYLLGKFQSWADKNTSITFTPILESAVKGQAGRSGYIYQVIEEDFADLEGIQTYLCGSPQMVYGTIDKLKSRGLQEENCYSDVFEFAPRDQRKAV